MLLSCLYHLTPTSPHLHRKKKHMHIPGMNVSLIPLVTLLTAKKRKTAKKHVKNTLTNLLKEQNLSHYNFFYLISLEIADGAVFMILVDNLNTSLSLTRITSANKIYLFPSDFLYWFCKKIIFSFFFSVEN